MHNNENTKEAEEIFSRILAEMERQGKKYAELIAYLELPLGTFSQWKAGRSRNFCEHLGAIAEYLGVDAGWLVTGETGDNAVNKQEQELLETFRKLDEEKRRAVVQGIKWLAE